MKVPDMQPVPTDGSADDVSTLMSMMDSFVMGQVNPTYERYLFRKRMQQPGEPFETFLADLKTMIKVCEVPASFGDEMLKDHIIFGIRDNSLHERLLQEKDLTLPKCTDMCKAAETASSHLKVMNQDTSTEVCRMKKPAPRGQARKAPSNSSGKHRPASSSAALRPKCKFCRSNHPLVKSQCPAWGQT